ncbi:elongation factor P 5-aminopentanone reductase [Metasolibacillus fluoroglycofenilyticus]|uniref:elongation factor P 5-aminopentanone reductase n=1 Tax=Metasolibacillus fluoroglycofenilyticus TaxID=1239396 RepID=UPI000D393065|nr:SDR family oxidoreductase [Metasolibacillus fluoroglycofenilyticus]
MKKYALVCGASGEIGTAICQHLAQQGWSLYVHYASKPTTELVGKLSAAFPQQEFFSVQADFTCPEAASRLAKQIFTLQAIVFANGHASYGLLEDIAATDMQTLWQVHMQTPMLILQQLAAKLRTHSVSYVIFIGSIWGAAGAAGEVVYSAVKGAQHSFVKAYAQEVAYNGIRVNALAPGFIATKMNSHIDELERKQIISEIPLQQLGTVEDVARLCAFYVSGQADYVTGQIIHLNGGWYI